MNDKGPSNIPGRITAPAEMLEAAVGELLRRIPETWQAYKPDDLSETKAQALFLLTAAGMVERRERLRLRLFNHPLVAEATIVFTGEYGGVEALKSLTASMWADWQDAYRQWRQGDTGNADFSHCERIEPSEWRLTDQGVIARKDSDAGGHDQGVVFDFVLKRGFFDGSPYEMPDGQVRRHEPIRGKGALLKLDNIKSEAAGTVNIGNWGAGGDAFAQAIAPVIVKLFEAMQAKTSAEHQPVPNGKEVPWNPDDPNYMPAKEAVALVGKTRPGFKHNDLNKVLKLDGPMRYMRNLDLKARGPGSVRCKIHKDDLSTWLDGLKRAATANERQGKDGTCKPTDTGDEQYQKGFAQGRADGYGQGYNDVKQGKPYSCRPPFQDDPDDQYVHGEYEGWEKGYAAGRVDSESGEPQKYGV